MCAKRVALVTGGSGYFGRRLVHALVQRGYEVRVFDVVDLDNPEPGVRFVRGDIGDRDKLRDVCSGVDVVHHNVAQVPLARNAAQFRRVNVLGAKNLFDACRDQNVPKVVNVSSSAVFGVPVRNPVDNAATPRPREAYGRAKWEAEKLAAQYVRDGLDITTIRPRTILGHDRLGIFQIVFELVLRGRPLYVLGNGQNRYQFVHADDLSDACIRAGEKAGPDVFNIGAARFGTMRELLEALVAHAGTGSRVRSVPMVPATWLMRAAGQLRLAPLGAYHALMYGREFFFDIEPARVKLGWSPRYSNAEMITESYDLYVLHRERILRRRGASPHRSAVRAGLLRLLMHMP